MKYGEIRDTLELTLRKICRFAWYSGGPLFDMFRLALNNKAQGFEGKWEAAEAAAIEQDPSLSLSNPQCLFRCWEGCLFRHKAVWISR